MIYSQQQKKKYLHDYGLYQLNVMFFWTLVMPVVKNLKAQYFSSKIPDFSTVCVSSFGSFYTIKNNLPLKNHAIFEEKNIVLLNA